MATNAVINEALKEAKLATKNAQEVRSYHRRRTERGDKQREQDLTMALERVKEAMVPLRSAIGKFPYERETNTILARQQRIRDASKGLQRERRKLWKMLHRPDPTEKES